MGNPLHGPTLQDPQPHVILERPWLPTRDHHMLPVNWPYSPETYGTFTAINRAGFTHYCCGDRRAPQA